MTSTIFQIEKGTFALALVDRQAAGYADAWQAPAGKSVDTVTAADYDAASSAFTCQATSGALQATANVTNVDVPASFCSPASSTPVAAETSYALAMSFLQDPNVADGINRYLFEHDTKEAFVYFGLDGTDPPRMIGRVKLVAGTIGGAARTTLTFDTSFPLVRKPDVEFGTAGNSDIVTGAESTVKNATPGSTHPAEATITASDATNAAKLAGLNFVASPTTAWTTGQKFTVGTFDFNWSGTAFAAGSHA